jgi:transposase InsO family protein
MSSYNSYHSNIKLLAVANLLPSNYKAIIPNSTIASWKNNPEKIKNPIGINDFIAEPDFMKIIETMSKKEFVYKTFKTIIKIVLTYSAILNSIKNKKKILSLNKNAIVHQINSLTKIVGLKRACSVFNITTNQYRYWKNSIISCTTSPIKLCRKSYNHQLLKSEIEIIRHYFTCKAFLYWPISSVYYQILRDKAAFFSISTCYNYVNILGIKRHKMKNRRKNHKIGLRASAPLELLHMDISIFKTLDNAKVYLYLICDNFSRCILGYKVSTKFDVNLVLDNIREVKQKYTLLKKTLLITDNGIENKTTILEHFLTLKNITKQIAQLDIIESNSMIETVIKQLKYHHIYPKNYITPTHFINDIDVIVNAQINRPLGVLNGLTPTEVLHGNLPNENSYKNEIDRSRKNRLIVNRIDQCGVCSNP